MAPVCLGVFVGCLRGEGVVGVDQIVFPSHASRGPENAPGALLGVFAGTAQW